MDKDSNIKFIKKANFILLGIAVVTLVGWFINITDLQKFISNFFVWTNK